MRPIRCNNNKALQKDESKHRNGWTPFFRWTACRSTLMTVGASPNCRSSSFLHSSLQVGFDSTILWSTEEFCVGSVTAWCPSPTAAKAQIISFPRCAWQLVEGVPANSRRLHCSVWPVWRHGFQSLVIHLNYFNKEETFSWKPFQQAKLVQPVLFALSKDNTWPAEACSLRRTLVF